MPVVGTSLKWLLLRVPSQGWMSSEWSLVMRAVCLTFLRILPAAPALGRRRPRGRNLWVEHVGQSVPSVSLSSDDDGGLSFNPEPQRWPHSLDLTGVGRWTPPPAPVHLGSLLRLLGGTDVVVGVSMWPLPPWCQHDESKGLRPACYWSPVVLLSDTLGSSLQTCTTLVYLPQAQILKWNPLVSGSFWGSWFEPSFGRWGQLLRGGWRERLRHCFQRIPWNPWHLWPAHLPCVHVTTSTMG